MALIHERIQELITPTVEDLGLEVWGVEFINSRHPVLRVYIDHADGITIEHCTEASNAVSALLDVEDPIEQEYDLEVSSPGFYRPLFTLAHYAQFVGEKVSVHLRMAQQDRRKFFGKIVEVKDNSVVIDTNVEKPTTKKPKKGAKKAPVAAEPQLVEFIFANILKANLEPDFPA